MTYSHRNIAEEQKEACQKVKHLTALCKELFITLDPVDWQNAGIRAWVTVNTIRIADLLDLSQQDSNSLLRRVQIKLLEHAALKSTRVRPAHKALIWSPVDVVQPQEFLSLWILTMETGERIAIAEYIHDEQRVYEHYELDVDDGQQLVKLFGPMYKGQYQVGETVRIEDHEQKCSGRIVYILPPGKTFPSRKSLSKASHGIVGKVDPNDIPARYVVACDDGFPHIVNQSQVSAEMPDDTVIPINHIAS